MKKIVKLKVTSRRPELILEFTGFGNGTTLSLKHSSSEKKSVNRLHEERMNRQGRGTPNHDISSGVKDKVLFQNLKNEGKVQAQEAKEFAKAQAKAQQ